MLGSVAVLSETPRENTTCCTKQGTSGFKFPDSVIYRSSFALNRALLLQVAMANLGCQFGYIWDQLKPKHLGMLWRIFLIESFEARRLMLNLGRTFWGGSPHKRTWNKKAFCLFLPVCFRPHLHVLVSCGWGIPVLLLEPSSSGSRCKLNTSSSPGMLPDSSSRSGLLKHPVMDWTTTGLLVFLSLLDSSHHSL